MSARASRRIVLALALGLSLLALIQAHHRATQGRCALLKWQPDAAALAAGEPIYEVGVEGYPTLPLTLLLLRPFHAAGPTVGPLLWAALKIALAWWIVSRALGLAARGRARDFPALGAIAVILLALRPLLSDVLHGNLNILVGATVAAAAWDWSRGRELRSGLWIGLGAVLKLTPALGLLYFAWKRSLAALAGALLGVAGAAFLVPGLALGWHRNLELVASFTRQMVAPYLAGRELTVLQTEHINQSLFGVLARLVTDSVAIVARPPHFPTDVRVNLLELEVGAFRALHLAACAAVLAWLLLCARPKERARDPRAVLGEFALLALAMLFLSERSWKHHYVLAAFPLAFLVAQLYGPPGTAGRKRVALGGLSIALLAQGMTGTAFLGPRGSDLAEAHGAFLLGGLALYAACGLCLLRIGSAADDRSVAPLRPHRAAPEKGNGPAP